jgi:hypothetical protein
MGACFSKFSKRVPDTPGTPGDLTIERARSFSKRTEMWERTGTVQCTYYSTRAQQQKEIPFTRPSLTRVCLHSCSPEFADLSDVSL